MYSILYVFEALLLWMFLVDSIDFSPHSILTVNSPLFILICAYIKIPVLFVHCRSMTPLEP